VGLDLLTPVGGDELSGPRYRCAAPARLVRAVAETLRFDLDGYLA
jgi:hypothetical protein